MFYAYEKLNSQYRIGVAFSKDLVKWKRHDNFLAFENSKKNKIIFDSEMQTYPSIFQYKNNIYMLYNGNNYGKNGVGLAQLI